jgi:hypothetical protein
MKTHSKIKSMIHGARLFFIVFFAFTSLNLITSKASAQGYNTEIKIIVTRSDNGNRVVGAEVQLFGQTYSGVYRTNEQGEIILSRQGSTLTYTREAILYCFAMGYYPAPRYDYGAGSSGKGHVYDFQLSAGHNKETIAIVLEPRSRNDYPPYAPIITEITQYNQIDRNKKLIKWEGVQGAYWYELQVSNNEQFNSPQTFQQLPHITNAQYQDHVVKLNYGSYLRVRASDGYQWGPWSETKKYY